MVAEVSPRKLKKVLRKYSRKVARPKSIRKNATERRGTLFAPIKQIDGAFISREFKTKQTDLKGGYDELGNDYCDRHDYVRSVQRLVGHLYHRQGQVQLPPTLHEVRLPARTARGSLGTTRLVDCRLGAEP